MDTNCQKAHNWVHLSKFVPVNWFFTNFDAISSETQPVSDINVCADIILLQRIQIAKLAMQESPYNFCINDIASRLHYSILGSPVCKSHRSNQKVRNCKCAEREPTLYITNQLNDSINNWAISTSFDLTQWGIDKIPIRIIKLICYCVAKYCERLLVQFWNHY